MSLLFLLAVLSAGAADLAVDLSVPRAPAPVHVTFEDVRPGPLPGLVVTAPDGVRYLADLVLGLEDGGAVLLDLHVQTLAPGRRGALKPETYSRPRLLTRPGVPASLTQGARVPIPGTDPLQYEEIGLVFEALYTDAPPVVATAAQAEAALGQLVQVSGQVGRAKLGDQVQTSEIALLCLDFRVPDELVGREATVEGELRRTAEFAATSDSEGAISQGTEPGTEMLVLLGCRVR